MPSGSVEAPASTLTASGAFPLDCDTLTSGIGGKLGGDTVIVVVAAPDSAFAAVNVTLWLPASLAVGVQFSVPPVLPLRVVSTAADSGVADSEAIALPSGSDAETLSRSVVPA